MSDANSGRRTARRAIPWLLLGVGLWVAAPALATTIDYGTYAGSTVTFAGPNNGSCLGGVCETPNSGATGLFGSPTAVGDQLLFFPSAFSASSSGGGVTAVGSQLQVEITSNSVLDVLDTLTITEFGDASLSGVGTAATGTFAQMSGFITVTEANGVAIAPVIIPWSGVFAPSDLLSLPGDSGTTLWSASVTVDIASYVANATKLTLSYDNNLSAYSEAGTSATIQKKVVSGPAVIISVPEPASLTLLSGALIGAALRLRRSERK